MEDDKISQLAKAVEQLTKIKSNDLARDPGVGGMYKTFIGPEGPQGKQGEKGEQGEQGKEGMRGPRGFTGEDGPQGEKGEKGDKGDKGDKGERGTDGIDGIDGKDFTADWLDASAFENGRYSFNYLRNKPKWMDSFEQSVRGIAENEYINRGAFNIINLKDLKDVNTSGITAGQTLVYNAITGQFDAANGAGSPLITKGDIFTFDVSNARLPIGTNGDVLTVDTTTPTGLKWTSNATVVGTGVLAVANYATTYDPATFLPVVGSTIRFFPDANCPASPTINGVLIKESSLTGLTNLEANDLIGGGNYNLTYNGTFWVLEDTEALGATTVTSIAADTTYALWNQTVIVDATGGPVTVTLPTSVGSAGQLFEVKRNPLDVSTNDIIIDASGAETIDGGLTYTLTNSLQSVVLRANGVNSNVVAAYKDITPPYTQNFNATTDWGAAAGGLYSITIPATTHRLGTNVKDIVLFNTTGGIVKSLVTADITSAVLVNGDVSFSVSDLPDGRFAGQVVITGSVSGSGGGTGTGDVSTTTPNTFLAVNSFAAQTNTADVVAGSTNAYYIGDPSTDGSWRHQINGTDLEFQRREAGVWVTKQVITP